MNRLLLRQLRRLGLTEEELPDDPEAWAEMLRRISNSYDEAESTRYRLERSLQISSDEMAAVYAELQASSEATVTTERDRLRVVLDSLPHGVCVLDADTLVVLANVEAQKMLETAEDVLVGSAALERFVFVMPLPDGMPARPASLRDHLAAGGSFVDPAAALLLPNGSERSVRCVLNPILSEDAGLTGSVMLFQTVEELGLDLGS